MCNHKWMTFGTDANGKYRVCSKCRKKVYIITNADRIRAMSDEEIAEVIMCPHDSDPDICGSNNCVKCCADWLRMPGEDV